MFELTERTAPSDVEVEFDHYTPVTATWPGYHDTAVTPVYARCVEDHRLLELKFHPTTRELVELVLVNAPGLDRQERDFPEVVQGDATGVRLSRETPPSEVGRLSVTAFDDCLVMRFSAEAAAVWSGSGPVFFGTDAAGALGAIGVWWTEAQRRLVLHEAA